MALDIGVFLDSVKNLFKAKVSSNDTQPDYLINKFTSSDASVTITETNDGGVEQINLQSAGGSDTNFATANLTFDGSYVHDLNGNTVTIEGNSGNDIFQIDPTGKFFLGALATTTDNTNVAIGTRADGTGTNSVAIGYLAKATFNESIMLNANGSLRDTTSANSFSVHVGGGTSNVLHLSKTSDSYITGTNLGLGLLTPTARFHIKSAFSTSATTALLVENSSGTDALKILDDTQSIFQDTASVGKVTIASVDRAVFAHKNHVNTTDFALLQTAAGITILNAISGQDINFNISNSTKGKMTSTGNWYLGDSTQLLSSNISLYGDIATKGSDTSSATRGFVVLDSFNSVKFEVRNNGDLYTNGTQGLSSTYNFGGGGSGDIASMTFTNGILTAVTTVP
jgi:hypothetical protein